jgi:Transposase IS4
MVYPDNEEYEIERDDISDRRSVPENEDDEQQENCSDDASATSSYDEIDNFSITTDYDDISLYNYDHDDDSDDDEEPEMIGLFESHKCDDITVTFNGADELLLARAKNEYQNVLANVQSVCPTPNPSPMQLFQIFFPESTRLSMLRWVADYSLDAKVDTLTDLDILAFIQLDLKAQYHRTSISHMFRKSQQKHYQLGSFMTERKYHLIMRALNNGRKKTPVGSVSVTRPTNRNNEIMSLFEIFSKNCAGMCFISGAT